MTTETSLEFVEKLEAFYGDNSESMSRLLRLAKTAALIEEHRLDIEQSPANVDVTWFWPGVGEPVDDVHCFDEDVHTAVRAVADKIKAGNHG